MRGLYGVGADARIKESPCTFLKDIESQDPRR